MSAPAGRALPTFVIIGAMKSGTTSLYQYVGHHPDVFMSNPKELHFFSRPGKHDVDWYSGHFTSAAGMRAIGEASASYTTYPDSEGVPERMASVIPEARLIYLVRHPIERMRSHYLHRLGAGKESAPIERALIEDPIYLRTSCYAEQIERFLEHYPRDQVMIVESERMRADRESTLHRILEFLGVDATSMPAVPDREYYQTSEKRVPRPLAQTLRRKQHARTLVKHLPDPVAGWGRRLALHRMPEERGQIPPDVRRRLEDSLRGDVRRLRDIAGGGFDGWGIE